MADLAEFLLARIAEDEALLHRDDREPHASHLNDLVGTARPETCPTCRGITLLGGRRALAECEAKRRIVEIMREGEWEAGWSLADRVLGNLALPYADHPDYRDEWKP